MFDYLYEWIQNIAFYLVLVTAIMHLVPNHIYTKYIQFFTGLLLVIMMAGPIFKICGMEYTFKEIYANEEYKQEIKEIEKAAKYLENMSLEEQSSEEIVVEEIRIGE